MIEKEYIVRVTKEDVRSRMFRYHIELIDPGYKSLAVAHDWCGYKFMINKTVKQLLKKQFATDNPNIVKEFRAKARLK